MIFGQEDKTRPSVATTKGGLVAVKMGKDGESAKLKEEKKSKDEIHLKVKSKGEASGEEDGKEEEVEVEIEAKFVEKEEVKDTGDGAAGKGTKKKDTKEKDKKKKEGGEDSGKAEEDKKDKAKDSEGKDQVKKEKKDGAGDKKEKKDKGEKNDKEKKEKKKDKGAKEKTTDPVKLRAKLEKVDTKLQDLHAKREDILRQLKELELEGGGKGKANEEEPAHVQTMEQGGESVVKEQSPVAAA